MLCFQMQIAFLKQIYLMLKQILHYISVSTSEVNASLNSFKTEVPIM